MEQALRIAAWRCLRSNSEIVKRGSGSTVTSCLSEPTATLYRPGKTTGPPPPPPRPPPPPPCALGTCPDGGITGFDPGPRAAPALMHVAIGAGFGSAIGGASRRSQQARFNPACADPCKVRIVFPFASAIMIGTPPGIALGRM